MKDKAKVRPWWTYIKRKRNFSRKRPGPQFWWWVEPILLFKQSISIHFGWSFKRLDDEKNGRNAQCSFAIFETTKKSRILQVNETPNLQFCKWMKLKKSPILMPVELQLWRRRCLEGRSPKPPQWRLHWFHLQSGDLQISTTSKMFEKIGIKPRMYGIVLHFQPIFYCPEFESLGCVTYQTWLPWLTPFGIIDCRLWRWKA